MKKHILMYSLQCYPHSMGEWFGSRVRYDAKPEDHLAEQQRTEYTKGIPAWLVYMD